MNKKMFYVAGMLCILAGASTLAASATDSSDPNLKHFYTDRLRVQVYDHSPIVTVFKPQQDPNYVIEVPNVQGSNSAPALIIRPSANPSNVVNMNGSPGNLLGPNGLPAAGLQSNMPSLAAPRQSLPNGGFSNHVATGQILNKAASKPQQAMARPMNNFQPPAPIAAVYKPQSVSGSQSNSVKTSAIGSLVPRGSLLK